ncbi:MAG: general stress protein [Gammaproteobacteria bacterium]|jgi:hypothetical protein|nr:general stress protein [Gammaproteobacteria bacterium]
MKRRLYFLLPDRAQAFQVIEQLNKSGIKSENIHALSERNTQLSDLPTSTLRQVKDTASRLEGILWNANLISFLMALCTFVAMILTMNWSWWLLIPVVTLVANFLAGLTICTVSNTQLGEFQDALDQGEILLMVDVTASRAAKVMAAVDYQPPETTFGHAGWGNTSALGT